MKHWYLVPCFLLLVQGSAHAANYGMAGCGLGSLVVKKDDSSQVLAATLNSTGVQTFGITTGTSNCVPASSVAALENQQHFVRENLESLHRDMVKGEGEYLESYANLLGCSSDSYPSFAAHTRSEQGRIFRAPGAMAVLEATKVSLRKDAALAQSCTQLI